ncbi:unnamed protein product [Urochloa humidicola]
MARVSSPPLPHPGASFPTSPTPAPTPGPAATSKGASSCRTAVLSPLALGSSLLSPVSPSQTLLPWDEPKPYAGVAIPLLLGSPVPALRRSWRSSSQAHIRRGSCFGDVLPAAASQASGAPG